MSDASLLSSLERTKTRLEQDRDLTPAPELPLLQEGEQPQRTIRKSSVLYGLGLHSGRRTGMAIQPLPPNSGIHFVTY